MRIALPITRDKFTKHFGKMDQLVIYEVDVDDNNIIHREQVDRASGACHALPAWISQLNIDILLVGGIGKPAKNAIEQRGIRVVQGIDTDNIEKAVQAYLNDPQATRYINCWGHSHCRTNQCGHD